MTQPGQSVEGITVPLGDPEALVGASRQLDGVSAQLESSAGRIFELPTLMGDWAGPGSSAFAALTGQHAATVQTAGLSISFAASGVRDAAHALHAAQQKAERAIVKAEHARAAIDKATADIAAAQRAEGLAADRMLAAATARDAAVSNLSTGMAGSGVALAALQTAEADYRDAERDLHEAQREEKQARDRLQRAEEDLKAARKQGADAATDAEDAGLGLQAALAGLPAGAYGLPGVPARSSMTDAAGIPRPQPVSVSVPISERQPPKHWPWWAKDLFKVGRGEATTIAGTAHVVKSGIEHPGSIPGALGQLGTNAVHHPLGTLKGLIGYDELAHGRYEDWFGQMGLTVLAGGAGGSASRAMRLRRVVGDPELVPIGRRPTALYSRQFAGTRMDFRKPDLGTRPGEKVPSIAAEDRQALAAKYPRGVRYTRAGYPVFTPYATRRVVVKGLDGVMDHDEPRANAAAGLTETPAGYTWHHVEDGRTMELVPRDLHKFARHTGGRAAYPLQVGLLTPGGSFTPGERVVGGLGAGVFGGATMGAGAHGP